MILMESKVEDGRLGVWDEVELDQAHMIVRRGEEGERQRIGGDIREGIEFGVRGRTTRRLTY